MRDRLDIAFDRQRRSRAEEHRSTSPGLRWLRRHVSAKPAAAPTLALPDKPSIAVLPFQNMSGDPEQEYFVDGMVEDIITALSRFKSLFVIARNSSFTYKGKSRGHPAGWARTRAFATYLKAAFGRRGTACVSRPAHRRRNGRTSVGRPLRRRRSKTFSSFRTSDGERGRGDRAAVGAGRDRARQAQADRNMDATIASCVAWPVISSATESHLSKHCAFRTGESSIRTMRPPTGSRLACHVLRANGWTELEQEGIEVTTRFGGWSRA